MTEEVQRDVDSKGKWQRGNGSPTSGSHTQQSDGETEAASPEGKRRLPRPSCPSVPHAAQNCKNPPLTSPSISLLWKHLLFLNFLGSFPIFSCQLRLARRTFCASERINAFAEDCYIKTLTWLIGTWEPCVLDPTSHSILPRYSPLHSFLHKSPPPPPFPQNGPAQTVGSNPYGTMLTANGNVWHLEKEKSREEKRYTFSLIVSKEE